MTKALALAAALLTCCGAAAAQPVSGVAPAPAGPAAPLPGAGPAPSPISAPAEGVRVIAGTPVSIALAEGVSSNGASRGSKFAIKLAAPIVVDGRVVAPAGAMGVGEVVYAEAGGAGGSPGKLVLAARYIDVGAVHIRLKAFSLAAGGEANFREMQVAASLIGPAVMLISGRNVLYPEGTRARAKLAEDVVFPTEAAAAPPSAAPAATPAPATPATPSTPAPEPKT